ncbi:hypothetical protein AArcCO_1408 [Halalkaliarchaeum sp. AArc-CO]|uniref:hypothetical protein n=1 Tax=Halalkaliarchaeum sp. AArc-CO TaxID=2866381 RepID=UPI00217CCCD4|nr:hypothetical protein [Halalkaliarchaeum sp. AArc-CO]UWG50715.1 hypothetical protein AArcCO_1408 [Halalkaliarchaeum sp. AArc-CO]
MENYLRNDLIEGIDGITSQIIPKRYDKQEYEEGDHERVDIGVELKQWLEVYLREKDLQTGPVNVTEVEGSVHRYVLEVEDEPNSFLITIHDPMGGHPKPAESITGVDYGVEYPVTENQDRFILVQTKRRDSTHGVPPKQFFAMGGVYMFGHYLMRGGKSWGDRFKEGVDYTNNFDNPHNEFLFIKYAEEPLYVPLSSVLNTHEFKSGMNTLISRIPMTKPMDVRIENENVNEQFLDSTSSKEPVFPSFGDFQTALTAGEIGLRHSETARKTERKATMFASLADLLNRPNIVLFEIENNVFEEVSDRIKNTEVD